MTEPKLYIEHPAPKTRCFIHQLIEGDRFYFVIDKKRIVWQVKECEKKKTWKYGGHMWAVGIKVMNDAKQVKYCLNRTQVIFLRNAL
ncbi:MAG: hypothetical protein EPN37_04395 [Chitinophagaceae bacterium]|nr:MAG: hypothetical protein EPN37_04395 [Chitinophagaceae bacterium]